MLATSFKEIKHILWLDMYPLNDLTPYWCLLDQEWGYVGPPPSLLSASCPILQNTDSEKLSQLCPKVQVKLSMSMDNFVLINGTVNGLENLFYLIKSFLPEVWWPELWEASAWTRQTATTLPAWAARELMTSMSFATTTLYNFQNSLLSGPVSLSWTTCVTDATTCSGTTTSTVSVGEH